MTKLFEKAFAEAAKLPAEEQDALASAVLFEIESERWWDRLFAESFGSDRAAREARGPGSVSHRRR